MTLMVNFGFYDAMTEGLEGWMTTSNTQNYLEIYSGTMIDDPDDWVVGGVGSPTGLLVTFSNFRAIHGYSTDVQALYFQAGLTPNPNPVNASATGTAAWYAMYTLSRAEPLIGEVTVTGGTGTLQLDSLSLTSGNPVTITHWGLRFE